MAKDGLIIFGVSFASGEWTVTHSIHTPQRPVEACYDQEPRRTFLGDPGSLFAKLEFPNNDEPTNFLQSNNGFYLFEVDF